jgi:TPR repeat protein
MQGNQDATFSLATAYFEGEGVKPNAKKAVALYFKNAKAGHIDSASALGQAFFSGRGVRKDMKEALA